MGGGVDPNNNAYDTELAFTNNVPFIACNSKNNNTLIYNVQDLGIAMSMCNLIENTKKFKNNKKFVELLQRWTK